MLLRDDFDAEVLDASRWSVPFGDGTYYGRTQVRPPTHPPRLEDGRLRLALETWNPWHRVPGDSFLGSEIVSRDVWAVEEGGGLSFRARVRLSPGTPAGLDAGVFLYRHLPGRDARDEIDFELLGNDAAAGRARVLTNLYDREDFASAGRPRFVALPADDLTAFHVYEIRCYADRVEWRLDDRLVRVETEGAPRTPMGARLNLWAVDSHFRQAYDAALQPATRAEDNRVFYSEVDWVEIRRLDHASGAGSLETE